MYDGVTNTSKWKVSASLSQSCASGVAENYLSCDESDVADPKFDDEVIYQRECGSHLF